MRILQIIEKIAKIIKRHVSNCSFDIKNDEHLKVLFEKVEDADKQFIEESTNISEKLSDLLSVSLTKDISTVFSEVKGEDWLGRYYSHENIEESFIEINFSICLSKYYSINEIKLEILNTFLHELVHNAVQIIFGYKKVEAHGVIFYIIKRILLDKFLYIFREEQKLPSKRHFQYKLDRELLIRQIDNYGSAVSSYSSSSYLLKTAFINSNKELELLKTQSLPKPFQLLQKASNMRNNSVLLNHNDWLELENDLLIENITFY